MGLGCCCCLIKWLVIIFNLVFWVAGLAVLVLSVWLLTDSTFYLNVAKDEPSYITGLYILLAAGAVMFIIAFLGCCGAYRESSCMLVTYFCFLLIVMVAEIAAGVWGFSNSNTLGTYVENSVLSTVQKEYANDPTLRTTFDTIQSGLQCCGAQGPSDWAHSSYNTGKLKVYTSEKPSTYKVPKSCCSFTTCNSDDIPTAGSIPHFIHSEGCSKKLKEVLRKQVNMFVTVSIVLEVLQLLNLIFSVFLCCAVRNSADYKA